MKTREQVGLLFDCLSSDDEELSNFAQDCIEDICYSLTNFIEDLEQESEKNV